MTGYWSNQITVLTTANGDNLLTLIQAVDPTVAGNMRMVNLQSPAANAAVILRGNSGACLMELNVGDNWTLQSAADDIQIGQIYVRSGTAGQKLNVELFKS